MSTGLSCTGQMGTVNGDIKEKSTVVLEITKFQMTQRERYAVTFKSWMDSCEEQSQEAWEDLAESVRG